MVEMTRRVISAGPPMRLCVLFGSQATGRAATSSDLDLAILPTDPDLSLAAESALVGELERAVGRPVDAVRLDHASAVLRWQIARDGVLIVSEPSWEWPRFRARIAAEHADIADAIERSTRSFLRRLARPAR